MREYGRAWAHRLALNTIAILVSALAACLPAQAQISSIAVQMPVYINPGSANDLGNGPLEIRVEQGNALFATSQGSGVGTTNNAPSTTVTLTATPTTATAPCVGCLLTPATSPSLTSIVIPTNAFISAYSGVTITMSTNVTIAGGAPLAWGAACPATPVGAILPIQAAVGADKPFYTAARICGYASNAPGAAVLPFPLGAH